jgi:hypothetical protein
MLKSLAGTHWLAGISVSECAPGTHPDYATLVDPLFRKRERGWSHTTLFHAAQDVIRLELNKNAISANGRDLCKSGRLHIRV